MNLTNWGSKKNTTKNIKISVKLNAVRYFLKHLPLKIKVVFWGVFLSLFSILMLTENVKAKKNLRAQALAMQTKHDSLLEAMSRLAAYRDAMLQKQDSIEEMRDDLQKAEQTQKLLREKANKTQQELDEVNSSLEKLRRMRYGASLYQPKSKEPVSRGKLSGKYPKPAHFSYGYNVRKMSGPELRDRMLDMKFQSYPVMQMDKAELRRAYIGYHYERLCRDVHEKTGLPASVIFAYLIIEATSGGVESRLFRNHGNPGGIKFRKGNGAKRVNFHDDCYRKGKSVPCGFSHYTDYEQTVSAWSAVFNAQRYKKCKSYKTTKEICHCLYKNGYHTGNNWRTRASLADEYWQIRKSYPTN